MKELPKPISQALKRSKLSQELSADFSRFLIQHPDWKSQTLYLLNDKNQKIEQVIQELLGVSINKQSTWSKEPIKKKELDLENIDFSFKPSPLHNTNNKQSLKDWKRENGFFYSLFECGNSYTFIRLKPFIDENFRQQFYWVFNKAKYVRTGWRKEKNIKTGLLKNKHNPGENVKIYLENNPLLKDKNTQISTDSSTSNKPPNPFVLNSCCTQTLLHMLFGHPLLFFNDSQNPLVLKKQKVKVQMHYVVQEGYKVIFSTFQLNKKSHFTFDFQKNRDHIFFIGKEDKAIIIKDACFPLYPLDLEVSQLQAATNGISILDEDWNKFLKQWKKSYPNIEIKKTNESKEFIPEFTIANLMGWEFWLQLEKTILQKPQFLPKFQFSSKMQRNSYPRVGVNIENTVPYNSNELEAHNFKDLEQLLHYTQFIKDSKKDQEFYLLNSVVASQFLQLARNYP